MGLKEKKAKKIKAEVAEDEEMETNDISQNGSMTILSGPKPNFEDYDDLCGEVNAVAQPLAPKKVAKKLYKLMLKASKKKNQLRQGIAAIHRAFRKNEKGIVVLAGNVYPMDIYIHLPSVCEEKDVPYIFTPSKEHLGLACGVRRVIIAVFIRPDPSYQELYDECVQSLASLAA